MNNFTYRSNEEKDNLEAILRKRKRKFNLQQWVARFIMFVILLSISLYVAKNVYYTVYNGYVQVNENKVRAPFDIFLDSIYVKVGDIVGPGDTLYSYYVINTLVERANPNRSTGAQTSNRDLRIKHQAALRDISVLRVQINELRKQIAVENHNIALGLSSNSHKLDLERTLSETRAKLRAKIAESQMYENIIKNLPPDVVDSLANYDGVPMVFDDRRSQIMHESIAYNISSDSSIVTNVQAPDRTILFHKEDILTTQHLDLEGNNLCILAYVPVDKIHRITLDSRAEVIVNNDFSYMAKVTALGLRTDEIPVALQSYFAKKNVALIARLEIDPDQELPFWCFASGLPVDVRVKNIDTWRKDISEKKYLWYITGKGLFEHMSVKPSDADTVVSRLGTAYVDTLIEADTLGLGIY